MRLERWQPTHFDWVLGRYMFKIVRSDFKKNRKILVLVILWQVLFSYSKNSKQSLEIWLKYAIYQIPLTTYQIWLKSVQLLGLHRRHTVSFQQYLFEAYVPSKGIFPWNNLNIFWPIKLTYNFLYTTYMNERESKIASLLDLGGIQMEHHLNV